MAESSVVMPSSACWETWGTWGSQPPCSPPSWATSQAQLTSEAGLSPPTAHVQNEPWTSWWDNLTLVDIACARHGDAHGQVGCTELTRSSWQRGLSPCMAPLCRGGECSVCESGRSSDPSLQPIPFGCPSRSGSPVDQGPGTLTGSTSPGTGG